MPFHEVKLDEETMMTPFLPLSIASSTKFSFSQSTEMTEFSKFIFPERFQGKEEGHFILTTEDGRQAAARTIIQIGQSPSRPSLIDITRSLNYLNKD